MPKYLVTTTINGPKYARFYVDAPSREKAKERSNFSDGKLVHESEDPHRRIGHIVSVEEVGREQRPEWAVIGVYTDTQNFTPFQFSIGADGPRDAVARALARMRHGNDKERIEEALSEIKSSSLDHVSRGEDARIASVRPTYRLKPEEHLYEISEFAA